MFPNRGSGMTLEAFARAHKLPPRWLDLREACESIAADRIQLQANRARCNKIWRLLFSIWKIVLPQPSRGVFVFQRSSTSSTKTGASVWARTHAGCRLSINNVAVKSPRSVSVSAISIGRSQLL